MARFYFDTRIGAALFKDPDGQEHEDAETAVASARMDAAQYIADLIARGGTPDQKERLVRDEAGQVIDQFMLADALGCISPQPR